MKRRDILKYTAALTGAAVGLPLATAILSGCEPTSRGADGHGGLAFFSKSEFEFVKRIVDTILPETDSPSASAVGVPETMDHMLANVYPEDARSNFRTGFEKLVVYLNGQPDLNTGIGTIEANAQSSAGEHRSTYLQIKQSAVAFYLSTQEVGTNFLNYLPVPGAYQACISVEEAGGQAWTL